MYEGQYKTGQKEGRGTFRFADSGGGAARRSPTHGRISMAVLLCTSARVISNICIADEYGVFDGQAIRTTASGRMTIWRGAESTGVSTHSLICLLLQHRDVFLLARQVRGGGE